MKNQLQTTHQLQHSDLLADATSPSVRATEVCLLTDVSHYNHMWSAKFQSPLIA